MNITDFIRRTQDHKIVPVFYNDDLETCKKVVQASYDAGVRTFEFVHRGTSAPQIFEQLLAQISEWPDLVIGIGTIYDKEAAIKYIDMGASFVVSPCLVEEVATYCAQAGVAYIPGIATIKEAFNAKSLGCQMIKIFPASVIGFAFAKALKSVMPDIAVMPTGGIEPTIDGLKPWFSANVNCVGMGSQLFDKNKISKKDYLGLSIDITEAIKNADLLKN